MNTSELVQATYEPLQLLTKTNLFITFCLVVGTIVIVATIIKVKNFLKDRGVI